MFQLFNIEYIYIFCWFSIFYFLTRIVSTLWPLFASYVLPRFKEEHNFKQYGKWAVITGSTDGIGKGFALELASKGLDICLISRNEEKLKNTAKEIESLHGVKTKIVIADFTETEIYGHIKKNIAELDIGILINNVGMVAGRFGPFADHDEQFLKHMINMNILSVTMMTSLVLPCMMAKKQGLIINLGALCGDVPIPYFAMPTATKAYVGDFGTCLNYELKKHNIQMTTLTTGAVLTKSMERFPGIVKLYNKFYYVSSVKDYVKSSLMAITSKSDKTGGTILHDVSKIIGEWVPSAVTGEMLYFIDRNYKKK